MYFYMRDQMNLEQEMNVYDWNVQRVKTGLHSGKFSLDRQFFFVLWAPMHN